jgi:hypothetical protein
MKTLDWKYVQTSTDTKGMFETRRWVEAAEVVKVCQACDIRTTICCVLYLHCRTIHACPVPGFYQAQRDHETVNNNTASILSYNGWAAVPNLSSDMIYWYNACLYYLWTADHNFTTTCLCVVYILSMRERNEIGLDFWSKTLREQFTLKNLE